jgi:hypothetical protein
VELKNILARQPGPEAAEQAALYRGSLRAKAKQLKAMAAELGMAQAQASRGGGACSNARSGGLGVRARAGPPCGAPLPNTPPPWRAPPPPTVRPTTHAAPNQPPNPSPTTPHTHRAQVAEYKYEIERLTAQLAELKRRWFEAKRREQQQQQQAQEQQQQQGQQQHRQSADRPGGGGAGAGVLLAASCAAAHASAPVQPAVKGGGFAMG